MAMMKLADVMLGIDEALGSVVKEADDAEATATSDETPTNAPETKEAAAAEEVDVTDDLVEVKGASDESILAVLEAAVADVEKTASADEPVEALMKLANDLRDQDFALLEKKADALGTHIADTIVRRLQDYEKQAAELQTAKTAQAFDTAAQSMALAEQAGYQNTAHLLEKMASATYLAGLEKSASLVSGAKMFEKGAALCKNVIAITQTQA